MSPRQASAYLFFREKREIREMITNIVSYNNAQGDDVKKSIDKLLEEL